MVSDAGIQLVFGEMSSYRTTV